MRIGLSLLLLMAFIGIASAQTMTNRLEPTLAQERGQRFLREEIHAGGVRSDGGFAYVAPARLDRKGDRDSDKSLCTLLEDGKPLPYPRSLHAAIREQGGGRYSHWTASQLYFSASDSSDPRTNGRKYELVSKESYIRRSAKITAIGERSSFAITAPDDARLRPVRVVLTNLDPQRTAVPRLARSGDPDLTSAASIVTSITNGDMTDEQQAMAIWKFLVDWRYHDYPAEQQGEVHDPVKLISVYGYGFCDDSAAAFCELATAAGMQTRSYGLSGHVVAEAFYADGWHMFDPDHEVVYRNREGQVASVAELEEQPALITRQPLDPLGVPSERMAELYTTRQDNRPFQAASSVPSRLRTALGAGDRVVFDFTDTRRVHRRIYVDQPLPQSFANGTWTRSISSTEYGSNDAKAIHVHWPYAILGGKLTMSSTDVPSDIVAAVSIDGNTFEPLAKVNENGDTFFLLEAWIERQPTAVYDYWLRINDNRDSVAPPSAAGITLHTHFQFAPRAHAQVKPGVNEYELYVQSAEDRSLDDWKGLQVELVWDELIGE